MAEIEYRILGPVEVLRDGEILPIRAPRQRALLAALLLEANRVLSVDLLTRQLWGAAPPARARSTIQSLVLRLRRLLAPVPAAGTGGALLTRPPGYLLRVGPGQLDLDRFEDLAAKGRHALAAGEPDKAARLLREALTLWRGEPLVDVAGAGLHESAVPRLRELRWQTVAERNEAHLRLGRHVELIVELPALITEQPLRERLYAQLMLALYRAGRQADALVVFQTLRRRLVDDLAVEPDPALQRLYQQILAHDPALDLASTVGRAEQPAPAGGSGSQPVAARLALAAPAQLPSDVAGFAGRDGQIARLDAIATVATQQSVAVVVCALSGTAGVGKTALAVHWAHRMADRFPDGQLYVNLRGFDPVGQPTSPAQALRGFLEAFAVPPERIPGGLPAQVGLYRSLLAGKRVLVVLDNARDAEQIRPLLPGSAGCLVIVTSRNQLSGLVAADGAHPIVLDLLTTAEAGQLLANRLGPARTAADPPALAEIVARCARLPLALAIVAARAAAHPRFPLGALARELRKAHGGLDAFTGRDVATDVRAIFSWSYRALDAPAARLFRLLGLHPGPDIAAPAAASLAGVPVGQAREVLAGLARVHLVTEHLPGRYTFHDLLRAYATELAHTVETEDKRRETVHRGLDHYLHTAYAGNRLLLEQHLEPIALTPARPDVAPETLADGEQAINWFTAEHRVLLSALQQAVRHGFDTHAWQLAWSLTTFHNRQGHWQTQAATQDAALSAAQRLGDPVGQAHAHRGLAGAYIHLGRHGEAEPHFRRALDLFRTLGDHTGQGSTHFGLATLFRQQDRPRESLRHARQALALYQAIDHLAGQASALNSVGWFHAVLGEHRKALSYCRQAIVLHQRVGDRFGEANTWDSLGYAHYLLGDHRQAVTCYQLALDLLREAADCYVIAEVLIHLGDVHHAAGDIDAARAAWQPALRILDERAHPTADRVRVKLGIDPSPDAACHGTP